MFAVLAAGILLADRRAFDRAPAMGVGVAPSQQGAAAAAPEAG
jgi:hypothetical protein